MSADPWLTTLSFLGAALGCHLLAAGIVAAPLDRPNERSLHSAPIPRAGGLAIWAGWALTWPWLPIAALWVVPTMLLALVSFYDDRRGVPVAWRLLAHVILSAAFILLAFPAWGRPAQAGAILTLVWLLNLFNFMDGADGLAGGAAGIGFGCYALAAAAAGHTAFALLNATLATACAGFLVFNFSPARVFLGDVGSVPLGFLAGALALQGHAEAIWPLAFPLLVFLPFVLDATLTLAKRALRRERVWQAHREHYYQRLIRMGWSHGRTALAYYALMLFAGASGLALARARSDALWGLVVSWLIIYAVLCVAVDRCWMRHRITSDNN